MSTQSNNKFQMSLLQRLAEACFKTVHGNEVKGVLTSQEAEEYACNGKLIVIGSLKRGVYFFSDDHMYAYNVLPKDFVPTSLAYPIFVHSVTGDMVDYYVDTIEKYKVYVNNTFPHCIESVDELAKYITANDLADKKGILPKTQKEKIQDSEGSELDQQRRLFESFMKKTNAKVNISRSRDGGYNDMRTEQAWACWKESRRVTMSVIKPKRANNCAGSFFVGGYDSVDENKQVRLSKFPKMHKSYNVAAKEAQRCANVNDGTYWVFGYASNGFAREESYVPKYELIAIKKQIIENDLLDKHDWKPSINFDGKEHPDFLVVSFSNKAEATQIFELIRTLNMYCKRNYH